MKLKEILQEVKTIKKQRKSIRIAKRKIKSLESDIKSLKKKIFAPVIKQEDYWDTYSFSLYYGLGLSDIKEITLEEKIDAIAKHLNLDFKVTDKKEPEVVAKPNKITYKKRAKKRAK